MLGSNWDESNQVGVKLGFRFRVVDKIHICKLMLGPRIKFVATHCHILIHLHSPLSQTLGLDYKFAKNTKSILCKKKDFAAHQHSFWFLSPNSQSQPNANPMPTLLATRDTARVHTVQLPSAAATAKSPLGKKLRPKTCGRCSPCNQGPSKRQ